MGVGVVPKHSPKAAGWRQKTAENKSGAIFTEICLLLSLLFLIQCERNAPTDGVTSPS